jgi:hypothetical protein
MPSASFSVAMASSFKLKRKLASSNWTQGSAPAVSVGASTRGNDSDEAASSSIKAGAIVSRSQPASASISPILRNEAPITTVATPRAL